jgi:hypothetical protein
MAQPPYMLDKPRDDVLRIKLAGTLDQGAIERLGHELEERWRELFRARPGGSTAGLAGGQTSSTGGQTSSTGGQTSSTGRQTKASAARPLVLIDMKEVTGCDVAARTALIGVQATLRKRAARTAYLADQPRFRGLALWVAHLAGDAGAKAVPTQVAADAWLGMTEGRVDDARGRTDELYGGRAPEVSGLAGAALRFASSVDRLRAITMTHELSGAERAAAALMKLGMWATEGYALPFTEEIVRVFGVRGAVEELARYRRVAAALDARYGERDAHLLQAFAALWNGCGYCSVGHLFASNLLRFRDEGVLFPIDQDELQRLSSMTDARVMERAREQLSDPTYAPILRLLERQYELKQGTAEGTTSDDAWLLACNAALDLSNECSILAGIDMDPHAVPPLSPIAKDRLLRHRYEAARQAERKTRSSVTSTPPPETP